MNEHIKYLSLTKILFLENLHFITECCPDVFCKLLLLELLVMKTKKLHSISKVHALTHSTRSILCSRSPVECSLNSSLQTLKRDKGGRKEWVRKWNVSRGLRILGQSTAHLSPSGYYGARGKRCKEKLHGGRHYHKQHEGRKHYLQHSNADLPEVQSTLGVTTALPTIDHKRNTRVWITGKGTKQLHSKRQPVWPKAIIHQKY